MIFFSFLAFLLFLPHGPSVHAEQDYTLQNLFEEYLITDSDTTGLRRFRFEDFGQERDTRENLRSLHTSWLDDWFFHIYQPPRPPQLPDANGNPGILYQSGIQHDAYQNRLTTSYDLLVQIEDELESALKLACKICREKQRIPLQTCPTQCPL